MIFFVYLRLLDFCTKCNFLINFIFIIYWVYSISSNAISQLKRMHDFFIYGDYIFFIEKNEW